MKEWQNKKESRWVKNEGQTRLRCLTKCDDMSFVECYCPFARGAGKHFKITSKKKENNGKKSERAANTAKNDHLK